MSQRELVKKIVNLLGKAGIEYMLTGSFVSSLQGVPRSTHDIDIVVNIGIDDVSKLVDVFPDSDFYLDEQSIREAVNTRQMFNLLDLCEGDKIDFWPLTDEPFDKSRFARHKLEEFDDIKLYVSAPEDTILMKLKWAKDSGGSEKQFTDALRVYEVQFGNLDLDYIHSWVLKLGVEELWAKLTRESGVDQNPCL